MPTSVRLDPETEALLQRLARRSGRSKSAVLREALHRLADESVASGRNDNLLAGIADLVGVAAGKSAAPARKHKLAYKKALAEKHRR